MAVVMSRYRVRAQADIRHAAGVGLHTLSEDLIKATFADGAVSRVEGDPLNECLVEIEIRRQGPHAQTLDEIALALQRAGYSLLRARIEDRAADLAAKRIAGGLSSFAAGRTISKHPLVLVISAALGVALVEWLAHRAEEEYEAWRRQTGQWVIAPIPREAPPVPAPVMLPA